MTMKKYLLGILLLCGVAYAGDVYRVRIPALGIDTTVEVEKVEAPAPEPPPEPEPDPTPDPTPDPPTPPPSAESPTGRTPKLLWSREQQAIWNRMRAESHPWMVWTLQQADAAYNYPDYGQYQALAYQITGEAKYGRAAWAKIQPRISVAPTSANYEREDFIEYVVWYDWLTPVLSDAERAEYLEGLNGWARYALAIGTPKYVGGFRVADSDQTIGQYLALRMLDKLTGSKWCEQLPADVVPAIKQYCEWAKGGEWIESASYNAGTTQLIAMGVAVLGDDAEPELAKYLDDAALAYCYRITPDLKDSYLWGDEEHGHAAFPKRAYRYNTLFCLLAHRDPHLQSLIADLSKQYPDSGYPSAQPWWRAFYLWNPYADSKDWRTLPPVHFAEGQGVLTYKTADTLFVAHCPPRMAFGDKKVDHSVSWVSDFWLYRDGEWKVGHATEYPSTGKGEVHSANTLKTFGLQSMWSRAKPVVKTGDGWVSITCSTSGPPYFMPRWNGPPSFVDHATRTIRFDAPDRITLTDDVKLTGTPDLSKSWDKLELTQIGSAAPVESVIYQGAELVERKAVVEVVK